MPGTQSKEVEKPDEKEFTKAEQEKQINNLLYHIALNLCSFLIPIQAGPKRATELYNGDISKGAQFLGICSAGSAALEFLLNPTAGCWSDDHGRKPMLLLGPVTGVITSIIYVLAPNDNATMWWVVFLNRVVHILEG